MQQPQSPQTSDSPLSTQDSPLSQAADSPLSPVSLEDRLSAVKAEALKAYDEASGDSSVDAAPAKADAAPAVEEGGTPQTELSKFLSKKTAEQKERSRILADAKAKHEEAERKLAAVTKLEERFGSKIPLLEQFENDPIGAWKAAGKDPKALIESALSQVETDPVSKMQKQIDALQAMLSGNLEAQKKAAEQASLEAQQAQAMTQLDVIKSRIYAKTDAGHVYPHIASAFSSEHPEENGMLQRQLIERMAFYEDLFARETGEIPDEEQLATYIETFYSSKNPGSTPVKNTPQATAKPRGKTSPLPSLRMARESQARDLSELSFDERMAVVKQQARDELRRSGEK